VGEICGNNGKTRNNAWIVPTLKGRRRDRRRRRRRRRRRSRGFASIPTACNWIAVATGVK